MAMSFEEAVESNSEYFLTFVEYANQDNYGTKFYNPTPHVNRKNCEDDTTDEVSSMEVAKILNRVQSKTKGRSGTLLTSKDMANKTTVESEITAMLRLAELEEKEQYKAAMEWQKLHGTDMVENGRLSVPGFDNMYVDDDFFKIPSTKATVTAAADTKGTLVIKETVDPGNKRYKNPTKEHAELKSPQGTISMKPSSTDTSNVDKQKFFSAKEIYLLNRRNKKL